MSQTMLDKRTHSSDKPSSADIDDDKFVPQEAQLESAGPIGSGVDHGLASIGEDGPDEGLLAYVPANDHEKALDKAVNRKFDFIVIPILTLNYVLASLDKNSLGGCRVGLASNHNFSLMPISFLDLFTPGNALTAGRRACPSRPHDSETETTILQDSSKTPASRPTWSVVSGGLRACSRILTDLKLAYRSTTLFR